MDFQDDEFLSSTESENELVFFQSVESMLVLNDVRYHQQAADLLRNRELSFSISNKLLIYSFENRGSSLRISNDGGFNFNFDNWVSLPHGKNNKLITLIFQFARSEAQMSSEL